MKDIKYFLEEEYKYCQTKIENIEAWDENIHDWVYIQSSLDFLRQKPFQHGLNNIDYIKELTKGFDLSDAELIMLGMFIMHHSRYFRDDYYGDTVPEIAKNMFDVLNTLIAKAPIADIGTLYRECKSPDTIALQVGDILLIPHNLTCTENNCMSIKNNIYVIRTLPHTKTRARDIYKMYPHNVKEKQVNFLRGTKFLVTKVEKIEDTDYHRFYMNELSQS